MGGDKGDPAPGRWRLREGQPVGTCDGCAEEKVIPYEWSETEAWVCHSCWWEATETDRLREALRLACNDAWSDPESAAKHYIEQATTNIVMELNGGPS